MLDRYQVDEVVLIRPVRNLDKERSIEDDLEKLQAAFSLTPMCVGGGIRSVADLDRMLSLPVERLILNSGYVLLNEMLIDAACERFGRQALVASLPVRMGHGNRIEVFASEKSSFISLNSEIVQFIEAYGNEVVLHDCVNEGSSDKFDYRLLERSPFDQARTILSGGIGPSVTQWAHKEGIAAVHVDNRILHSEFSVPRYRNV
jgi:cyclase